MFRLWREFQEFRAIRGLVRLSFSDKKDREKMADLVAHSGFMPLKAMMMATALKEIAANGKKSDLAPGLAFAVGVLARCEQYRHEVSLEQRAKDRGISVEDLMKELDDQLV